MTQCWIKHSNNFTFLPYLAKEVTDWLPQRQRVFLEKTIDSQLFKKFPGAIENEGSLLESTEYIPKFWRSIFLVIILILSSVSL
jgi:hypothetical protein